MVWEPNDGYKYEWNKGESIQFVGLKQRHLLIIRTLSRLFTATDAFRHGGALISGQNVMLSDNQLRRPDFAFFKNEQINNSLSSQDEPIPVFIIEVASSPDNAIKVEDKLIEYFKCGVQVVWHVFPENRVVYVYTSRKNVKICTEDDLCSAHPVLPDFKVSVNNLFTGPQG